MRSWISGSAAFSLLAVMAIAAPRPTLAQEQRGLELEESDDLPAVQNRKYRNEHELDIGVGLLPVDAFYKGVSATGAYLWHITDLWAVEGRFSYLERSIIKTSIRDKLERTFGEPPDKFAEVRYYGEAGLLFKPIYGKLSLLNRNLVYGEIYFSLNGVVARMVGGAATNSEPLGKGPRLAYGGSPGFGIRTYLNRYMSLRFDFRYLILYSAGEIHSPLALTLSLAFTTRTDLWR
jgi:outer membrane beta-barrel protein